MIHTIHYVLFSHRLNSPWDERPVVVLDIASQLLGTQRSEDSFYFWENGLDRVVVRRIGDVIDVAEAKLPHRRLALLRGVRRELVHEQAYLFITVLISEAREPLFELRYVDRSIEDHKQFLSLLFRHARQ